MVVYRIHHPPAQLFRTCAPRTNEQKRIDVANDSSIKDYVDGRVAIRVNCHRKPDRPCDNANGLTRVRHRLDGTDCPLEGSRELGYINS